MAVYRTQSARISGRALLLGLWLAIGDVDVGVKLI
jgi:hypothetical protein